MHLFDVTHFTLYITPSPTFRFILKRHPVANFILNLYGTQINYYTVTN